MALETVYKPLGAQSHNGPTLFGLIRYLIKERRQLSNCTIPSAITACAQDLGVAPNTIKYIYNGDRKTDNRLLEERAHGLVPIYLQMRIAQARGMVEGWLATGVRRDDPRILAVQRGVLDAMAEFQAFMDGGQK